MTNAWKQGFVRDDTGALVVSGGAGGGGSALTPGLSPSGVIAEAFPFYAATRPGATTTTYGEVSGGMRIAKFDQPVAAGKTITTINVVADATAPAGQTHLWFALYNGQTRAKLAVTIDDLATGWTANTVKSLDLTTPYVVPADFIPAVGVCQVATTRNKVLSPGGNTDVLGYLQTWGIESGQADVGLTVPGDAPATYTISQYQLPFYCYLT